MKRVCEFSPDRKYRYTLWREWQSSAEALDMFDGTNDGERGNRLGDYLMVIGLNPSTADDMNDDPTIRRCIDFAKRWGYGALCMTNLFAWRATNPDDMKAQPDSIGMDNDQWLLDCADGAGLILAAWGKHGTHLHRGDLVTRLLARNGFTLHALKKNGDGSPQHPLYVPAITEPFAYTGSK